jgi:hypothetical protein
MTTLHRYNDVQFAEFKEKNVIKNINLCTFRNDMLKYLILSFIIAKERQISLRYFDL